MLVCIRFIVVCIAPLLRSAAIQRLPSFSAATAVVPLPTKQSRTMEFSLLDAFIMRSTSSSGF